MDINFRYSIFPRVVSVQNNNFNSIGNSSVSNIPYTKELKDFFSKVTLSKYYESKIEIFHLKDREFLVYGKKMKTRTNYLIAIKNNGQCYGLSLDVFRLNKRIKVVQDDERFRSSLQPLNTSAVDLSSPENLIISLKNILSIDLEQGVTPIINKAIIINDSVMPWFFNQFQDSCGLRALVWQKDKYCQDSENYMLFDDKIFQGISKSNRLIFSYMNPDSGKIRRGSITPEEKGIFYIDNSGQVYQLRQYSGLKNGISQKQVKELWESDIDWNYFVKPLTLPKQIKYCNSSKLIRMGYFHADGYTRWYSPMLGVIYNSDFLDIIAFYKRIFKGILSAHSNDFLLKGLSMNDLRVSICNDESDRLYNKLQLSIIKLPEAIENDFIDLNTNNKFSLNPLFPIWFKDIDAISMTIDQVKAYDYISALMIFYDHINRICNKLTIENHHRNEFKALCSIKNSVYRIIYEFTQTSSMDDLSTEWINFSIIEEIISQAYTRYNISY